MIDIQNYPWYLQNSPNFKRLYDGLFSVAVEASPLGIGDMFNVDELTGASLYRFGEFVGLRGNPFFTEGLIYNFDNWSETKVWSGQVKDIDSKIYKNFVRMKAFLQAQSSVFSNGYSLILIKEALAIVLAGYEYQAEVEEDFMEFTIKLSANEEVLRIFQELQSYDRHFLGKPAGIAYKFEYIVTSQGTVEN